MPPSSGSSAGSRCLAGPDETEVLASQLRWGARVSERANRFRFVGTLPFDKSSLWTTHVHTLAERTTRWSRLTGRVGIPDITIIPRLLRAAPRHDLVFLNGGERADLLYLAIAACCPWIRAPHVIVDAHWQLDSPASRMMARLLFRLGRRLLRQVQPHSEEEIAIYAEDFGIDPGVVHPVPWSDSITGYERPAVDETGDYVLSGGISYRDYDTLLPAVGELGLPLRIGVPAAWLPAGLAEKVAGYPNVSLHTDWTYEEYWRQVARCRLFAMPIQAGLRRCTADQTMLSAMSLNRVVVASDAISSRLYIDDGVNGHLVMRPSREAWVAKLREAWDMPRESRLETGAKAGRTVRLWFNESWRIIRTLDAALKILSPEAGYAGLPVQARVLPPGSGGSVAPVAGSRLA